jgi:hypothetical protein
MAIRIQIRRDTAANWTSANPVLRAGEFGVETDTLKFKIGNGSSTWTQITNYANVTSTGLANSLSDYILAADQGAAGGPAELDSNGDLLVPENSIILWDDAGYTYTTTVSATQPTANRTITLPDATGTVALTTDLSPYAALSGATFTGNINVPTAITFEGATADSYETTVQVTDPTADRTITFPDAGGTVALTTNIPSTTDNLSEGSTNKYYTDERAQDAIATAIAAGTHTNITITYDDDNNKFTFVGANTYSDENAQDAVGNAVGTGLSYNDTTGAISVDTTAIQARVADVSDTEIGYLNGVTSAIQTQLNDKAPIASPTFTGTVAGITKSMVGLGNVDNTTDANKPVSTATQTALDLKAPLASPTFTGSVTLPGAPTSDLHAATKLYVDNVAAGINFHEAVHAASTTNSGVIYNNGTNGVGATLTADTNRSISLLDGETVVLGQRILMKNQTDAKQNGIYTLTDAGSSSSPWVFTRATDSDNNPSGEMKSGDFVFVQNGAVNGAIGFINNSTANPIVIGTSDITYVEFNAGKGVTAGNGLAESTPGTLTINTSVTADLSTSQTLTNKTINANANTITVTSANVSDFNEAAQDAIGTILGTGLSYNDAGNGIGINYVTLGDTLLDGVSGASYGLIGTSTYLDVKTGNGYNKEIELDIAAVKTQLNTDGYLTTSSTSTLTNKTLTSPKINEDVALTATATELNYVDGVTSAIQTQMDLKAPLASPTFTGTLVLPSTVNGPSVSTSVNLLFPTTGGHITLGGSQTTGNLTIGGGTQRTTGVIGIGTGATTTGTKTINVGTGSTGGTTEITVGSSSGATSNITLNGTTTATTLNLTNALGPIYGGTGLTSYSSGDILYASATNTLAKLAAGTNGQILTLASGVPSWAAAPITLPTQTDNAGKYLTTDGTNASWGTLVVPITTGTSTVSANTATTIDTTALSAFTSIEYMVSLKQGSKIRTSKVVVQTDGTFVDMTEFAITETGGTIAGVVVSVAVSSTNAVLQLTATDAVTTNVTVKFSKVAL